jgi:hypothetical protein
MQVGISDNATRELATTGSDPVTFRGQLVTYERDDAPGGRIRASASPHDRREFGKS